MEVLYRAVDKAGDTVDFLFRAKRNKAAARRYFEKAIAGNGVPETVIIDRSGANLAGLNAINADRELRPRHHLSGGHGSPSPPQRPDRAAVYAWACG